MPLLLHPISVPVAALPEINRSGISAGDSFSPQIAFAFVRFSRCRVSAGTFDPISGSRPILQASAISTALMLTGRSSTLALANFTSMENSSANPVWALISSSNSVKSTGGSRSLIILLSRFRLSGSSRLARGEIVNRGFGPETSSSTASFSQRRAATCLWRLSS